MASVNLDVSNKADWLPANPWAWLGAGIALTGWSWLWTLAFPPAVRDEYLYVASDARIFPLLAGLLCAGIGASLRSQDREGMYILSWRPGVAAGLRWLLTVIFALGAVGISAALVLSIARPERIDLHAGPACLLWLTIFPLTLGAALRTLKRKDGQGALEVNEELSLAFVAVAVCCLLGSAALMRDPDDPTDWDSMRLFLRVFAFAAFYAAGLAAAAPALRRLMLSLVFVLHFTGISSAALSAPPAPWIVQQAWMRLFRPYLEFMYLNNAYHFYAPEPGPSSYLWFRVIMTPVDGGEDVGLWYKLPQLDEKGHIKHPVALEYQRYLSLTESVAQTDMLPAEFIFDEKAQMWKPQPMFYDRLMLAETEPMIRIGVPMPKKHFRIPLHPDILKTQQVNIPADGPRRLLRSFARHVAHKYAQTTDENGRELVFKSVKIYRVLHTIPPIGWFQYKLPPNDPTLYRPFYVGNFAADGRLIEDQDPYRYWLVPILREMPNDPNSRIRDYCRLHAGDPNWIRMPGDRD